MYKFSIFNDAIKTDIHYPTTDEEAPHIFKINKKESDSQADSLTFTILQNNPGYDSLYELKTLIQAFDIRDNTISFDGRILSVSKKMDTTGAFYKEVVAEGSLNYLVDTTTRKKTYELQTPIHIITDLLTMHNSKVDAARQISVGKIEIENATTISVNYQSTLSAIQLINKNLGGHFVIRLENGVRYLDYYDTLNTNIIIQMGENMKDMLIENDLTGIGTRIVPVGKDELSIESVNNGKDYIDNVDAIAVYGVMEKPAKYNDIEDPTQLMAQTLQDLNTYATPKQTLECSALDLSVLSNNSEGQFTINRSIRIINPVMNIDAYYEIIETDRDMLNAQSVKLVISNKPDRLSGQIIEFNNTKNLVDNVTTKDGKMNTYWLDGVINALKNQLVASGAYTNVQVVEDKGLLFENTNAQSDDFGALYLGPGLFAIANAKTVDNKWNWRSFGTGKGFTADEIVAGVLKGIKIQEVDSNNGNILTELYKNENGGLMEIFDTDGNLNVKVGSENGINNPSNNGGTFILYDDATDKPRVELGISKSDSSGGINLKDSSGNVRVSMYADSGSGPVVDIRASNGWSQTYLAATEGVINGSLIATQNWVEQYVADHSSTP